MEQLKVSLPQLIGRSQPLKPSAALTEYAVKRARLLFSCYRKNDVEEPEVYLAAITAILSEHSADVIERVTDPQLGIQRELKFLPSLAEVSEGCKKKKQALDSEKKLIEMGWDWNGERWIPPA